MVWDLSCLYGFMGSWYGGAVMKFFFTKQLGWKTFPVGGGGTACLEAEEKYITFSNAAKNKIIIIITIIINVYFS